MKSMIHMMAVGEDGQEVDERFFGHTDQELISTSRVAWLS